MNQNQRIQAFTEEIWHWYARHKRELPWRDMALEDDDERAYRVLVSEIMLQQTQVSRVKIVFKEFLSKFGSLKILSEAKNSDVILAWRGMGYNSRVLRLRDAAHTIVHEHDGHFPRDMDGLLAIKGIGTYTASAIRNFAWNMSTPCIDTNIRRIFHRTFFGPEAADGSWNIDDKTLMKLAEKILNVALTPLPNPLPQGEREQQLRDARNWHAALMDFGSMVQTKRNPQWDICPLTAKGIMLTTRENFPVFIKNHAKDKERKEPGRMEGASYVPNRIFRGRIVEALRDHPQGLALRQIGPQICNDWNPVEHQAWLEKIVEKLTKDALLARKDDVYVLAE